MVFLLKINIFFNKKVNLIPYMIYSYKTTIIPYLNQRSNRN